jgi:MazG family protein
VTRPFAPITPPALSEQDGSSYPRLIELMRRLLAPDGCPWDREQTFGSLRRFVLEEASEVVDAIDGDDRQALRQELGDLLLQIVFLGELGRAEGAFGPDDVVASIVEKLLRRHPHVFGEAHVTGAHEVLRNWERIKATEREQDGKPGGLLASVPRSLPVLARAQRVGEKVARVGFDWPDRASCQVKVREEISELEVAVSEGSRERMEEELGDVLFALTNLARHLDLDAEAAMSKTVVKFVRRFAHVEQRVREQHGGWPEQGAPLPIEELDGYWSEAKKQG